ncbi:MAG TPA: hypothetical protein DCE41_13965 [Cytophagales bacterium]|nr:hypothetical protein [Cytophagales bacterium]HAA20685.1 hypothetical protein [Cytophagales bacterium]HAP65139.1 hypothetical protein [Cytophagales bacterium]
MKRTPLASLFLLFSISSCVDCSLVDPNLAVANIRFVDSAGEYLIGNDSTYIPENMVLYNAGDTTRVFHDILGGYIYFEYSQWENNEVYFLQINAEDTDTLSLVYHLEDGPCFANPVIDTLRYNDLVIAEDRGRYDIVKP